MALPVRPSAHQRCTKEAPTRLRDTARRLCGPLLTDSQTGQAHTSYRYSYSYVDIDAAFVATEEAQARRRGSLQIGIPSFDPKE